MTKTNGSAAWEQYSVLSMSQQGGWQLIDLLKSIYFAIWSYF